MKKLHTLLLLLIFTCMATACKKEVEKPEKQEIIKKMVRPPHPREEIKLKILK